MVTNDEFAAFLAEELARNTHPHALVLRHGYVAAAECEGEAQTAQGDNLAHALNRLSRSLGYTTKDLRIENIGTVNELVDMAEHLGAVTIQFEADKWTVSVANGLGGTAANFHSAVSAAASSVRLHVINQIKNRV